MVHAGRWSLHLKSAVVGVEEEYHHEWYSDRLYEALDCAEARYGLTADERTRLKRLARDYRKLGRAVEQLDQLLEKKGTGLLRRLCAYYAAIGPLNRQLTTGGMERGLSELSDNELASFVAAGLERERILLSRERDIERAQALSAKFEDPDDVGGERQLGKTDAMCSWDFMRAERLYANKTIAYDWAE